jgi:thymidylate kinase
MMMIFQELNNILATYTGKSLFIFLTGASGAGKTSLARLLEQKIDSHYVHVAYFDSIEIPSPEKMVQLHGSIEKWQEAATHLWIEKLAREQHKPLIIFEGQYNPHFAVDACAQYHINNYLILCADVATSERERRLIEQRQQPELVNENMQRWADFLKNTTQELHGIVINTAPGIDHVAHEVITIIKSHLIHKKGST